MKWEDFYDEALAEVQAEWEDGEQPNPHPDRPKYAKNYGAWAGNEKGHAPNFGRCCEKVYPRGGFPVPSQCNKKARFDPDETGQPTRCGVHRILAQQQRLAKAKAKGMAQTHLWRSKRDAAARAAEALRLVTAIANGHNDARGACLEFIRKWGSGGVS